MLHLATFWSKRKCNKIRKINTNSLKCCLFRPFPRQFHTHRGATRQKIIEYLPFFSHFFVYGTRTPKNNRLFSHRGTVFTRVYDFLWKYAAKIFHFSPKWPTLIGNCSWNPNKMAKLSIIAQFYDLTCGIMNFTSSHTQPGFLLLGLRDNKIS